ncbi:aromatic ring-hydroxylating dioxygenase subunit alpha [Mesorhizobium sp. BAC0120]|uniref:aromatic ring-hydroxylating dioxygenase subunit alpha n=1 Tax=Mesorhizobium sp. BAC0120 TaxID=3090670 RepID=UPI00298C3D43|nr:aromatic ring-hydroxylating dioxygenase subunit alpha [Mesorhizobium sp. BAC0120]MDW6024900.1 aromatic ring-hydroxylating dioxygenase subunit alpha [Mesorhizobium sp. BAC0120]
MAVAKAHECSDRMLLNDWHVVADEAMLNSQAALSTCLFGVHISVGKASGAPVKVMRTDTGAPVASAEKYGFVWACLGEPERDIIDIPEAWESDRHLVTGGSIAVKVSGLRAVENFLDMGHFPFVHTGLLGEEPHTEVAPYKVEITEADEVLATECKFYQPLASPTAKQGFIVDYIYKVIRPYTVALYKSNPVQKHRLDVIVLFVQPVDEENCVAHPFLCYLKDNIDAATVRWFMQLIFAQDKPILENQLPKRLPLDPAAETPIRADASSVYYRRWLRSRDVTYGAIPARA